MCLCVRACVSVSYLCLCVCVCLCLCVCVYMYVSCVLLGQTLTASFRQFDTDMDGWITIGYEQFVSLVFNLKS